MVRFRAPRFRLAGVPVRVHWSFALVSVVLLPVGAAATVPLAIRAALLAALTVSLAIHEAGHVAAARRLGLPLASITLYPFGGVTRTARPPAPGREEALFAAAGPAANLLLAGALAFSGRLLSPGLLRNGVLVAAAGNLAIAAANLLPALPLDGGRIARSLLASRIGPDRAERLTARAGWLLGLVLIAAGVRSDPWWAVPGAVLVLVSGARLGAVSLAAALRDPPVEEVMLPDPERADRPGGTDGPAIAAGTPASEALAILESSGHRAAAVVDGEGVPVGVVTAGMLRRTLRFGRRLASRLAGDGRGPDGAPGRR